MSAILWRKIKIITTSKLKVFIFFINPFIILPLFYYRQINIESIVVIFPYIFTGICTMLFFSMEDLIFSEVILATPITLKKIWVTNALFTLVVAFVYAEITLAIFIFTLHSLNLIQGLSILSIILNVSGIFFTFGMLLASTLHLSDYSKSKQYFSSVFAGINVLVAFVFIIKGDILNVTFNVLIIVLVATILLVTISFMLFKNGNKERLIINTQSFINNIDVDENIISE
ncbi:MAG: hypothetical protein ACREV6_10375 [Clostridium sp.]|uniref:hypothetical protein n=1 Tax=Clostridium sp. TaxID=1506 RepID=UPI003D6CA0B9